VPLYDVNCQICGVQETFARMSTATFLECPRCGGLRPKGITLPHFTEDRLRFWKGPMGNGYSHALGAQMPETRTERDRLAREKGVEFVGRTEFLAENKEAAEAVGYAQHVKSGGTRDEQAPAPTSSFVPTPDWAKGLV
jgi:putative FmdB family regulatory protein